MKRLARKALATPPHRTLGALVRRSAAAWRASRRRRNDVARPTYCDGCEQAAPNGFWSLTTHHSPARSLIPHLARLCRGYLEHRFNLLGSGEVQVRHGMRCRGYREHRHEPEPAVAADPDGRWLEGRINDANLPRSQQIWRLIDADYTPIDWQLDFKSGYRWSERTWHGDVRLGPLPGVDVKVPWELSRMQHLPQMALMYAALKTGEDRESRVEERGSRIEDCGSRSSNLEPRSAIPKPRSPIPDLPREFRNQVLDFMATNPPRFGVNWACPMDAGIRVANWLVAWDLFRAAGAGFDPEFERELMCSASSHALYIIHNLERTPRFTGNHYLADLAGLLFAAAWLPASEETDAWLAFAIGELVRETAIQFHPDGGNYEASVCYHRLSAEIVAWCTALALAIPSDRFRGLGSEVRSQESGVRGQGSGVRLSTLNSQLSTNSPLTTHQTHPSSRLPASHFERLERMAEFTMAVTKPNGRVHQLGDNDSGRFLILQPSPPLDHRSLVATINGLVEREEFAAFCGPDRVETKLARALARRWQAASGSVVSCQLSVDSGQEPGQGARGKGRVRVQSRESRVESRKEPRRKRLPLALDSGLSTLHSIGPRPSTLDARPSDHSPLTTHRADPSSRSSRGTSTVIPLPDRRVLDGLETIAFPDFGLYIWRSSRLYLAVRCGPVGQNGLGGHAHNDQLAVELNIDGEEIIADPGTCVYLPDPARRNAWRSVSAHFAPQTIGGREPARLDRGLFRLDDPGGECLHFSDGGFLGRHRGFGGPVYRSVRIEDNGIVITDWAESRLALKSLPTFQPGEPFVPPVPFSPAYGVIDTLEATAANPEPLERQCA